MYCSTVESESFLEKAFFLCVCSKMFTNHYVKCIQIQAVAEYTAMYKKTLTVTKKMSYIFQFLITISFHISFSFVFSFDAHTGDTEINEKRSDIQKIRNSSDRDACFHFGE